MTELEEDVLSVREMNELMREQSRRLLKVEIAQAVLQARLELEERMTELADNFENEHGEDFHTYLSRLKQRATN